MTPAATAKDLLSTRVVVVRAEQRLQDVASELREARAQYCLIVSASHGTFAGLVRLDGVAAFSHNGSRIFADLADGEVLKSVGEDEPAESVLAALGPERDAILLVRAGEGRCTGLITPESTWAWLVARQAVQQKRLESLLREHRALGDFLEKKVEQRTASLRAALDEFRSTSAMLSHDAGGPLRTIKTFTEMLSTGEYGTLNEEGHAHVGRILRACGKLQALADDVLGRANEAGKAVPTPLHAVDLNEVVDDAIELAQALLRERNATVRKRAPLHVVAGRYVPLLQIVSNLLVNAVKYVPGTRMPNVEIWSEEGADGRVLLCIADNGRGIETNDTEAVFQPFVRIDENDPQSGMGLGLSIARKAVTDLGGTIRFDSRLGEGSVFKVELPAASAY